MNGQSERERKLEELQSVALPADEDTEDMLIRLDRLQARRRKDPVLEREYERLRDALAARLEREGPRYYIDDAGEKRYAYAVVPEPMEVDVDLLVKMDEAGELKEGVLDKVAPRKVDKEEFRMAVHREDITREQFLKVAKIGRGTPYVKHSDPVDDR